MATDTGFGDVRFFEDFLGDALNTLFWIENHDTSGTVAPVEAVANGNLQIYTDGTDGDIQNLFGVDQFIPATQGTIIFECRAKMVTSISQGVFIGLTDQNDADEVPIDNDDGTLTTTASDAVGFVYDSGEGTHWACCSVKADADGTQTDCEATDDPVLNTYQTFRITVESNGDTRYFINGKEVTVSGAARTAAITTTDPLAACVAQLANGTAGSVYVDYIYVSAGRA